MLKDIFIDTNIAPKLVNPNCDGYSDYMELVEWLFNDENNGYLLVSQKLLNEYSSTGNNGVFNALINQLTISGRLARKESKEISKFKSKFFTKRIINSLNSNREDWNHIALIMLSARKLAVSDDKNFREDIINFPRFNAVAKQNPKDLNYK